MPDGTKAADKYDESLKKLSNSSLFDRARGVYDVISAGGKEEYERLAEEARVNNALLALETKRTDAAAGITGKAGQRTIAQRSESNLRNNLGKTQRQYEDFKKNVDHALGNLEISEAADETSSAAGRAADDKALALSQHRSDADYGLQKQQLDVYKSDSEFNKAYQLYLKRLIKKDKFKDMTGIAVRNLPRPKKKVVKPLIIQLDQTDPTTKSPDKNYTLISSINPDTSVTKYLVDNKLIEDAGKAGVAIKDDSGRLRDERVLRRDVYGEGAKPSVVLEAAESGAIAKDPDYVKLAFSNTNGRATVCYVKKDVYEFAKGRDVDLDINGIPKNNMQLMRDFFGIGDDGNVDYDMLVQNLKNGGDKIIDMFGIEDYSLFCAYASYRAAYLPLEHAGLDGGSDGLSGISLDNEIAVLDGLVMNSQTKKALLGDEEYYRQLQDEFGALDAQFDNVADMQRYILDSGNAYSLKDVINALPEYEAALVYTGTDEDKMRRVMGLVPAAFDIASFEKTANDLAAIKQISGGSAGNAGEYVLSRISDDGKYRPITDEELKQEEAKADELEDAYFKIQMEENPYRLNTEYTEDERQAAQKTVDDAAAAHEKQKAYVQWLKDKQCSDEQELIKTSLERQAQSDPNYRQLILKADESYKTTKKILMPVPGGGYSEPDAEKIIYFYESYQAYRQQEENGSVSFFDPRYVVYNGDPEDRRQKYMYLTPDEIDTIKYFYATGDEESFIKYRESIKQELEAKQQQANDAEMLENYRSEGILGKALSAANAIVSSFKVPQVYLESIGGAINGQPTDRYSPSMQILERAGKAQEFLTEDMSPVLKAITDTGIGIADFATKLPFGPLAVPVMALESAGQSAYNVIQNGGSYGQAVAEGTVNGALTYALMKLPVDRLLGKKISGLVKTGVEGTANRTLIEGITNALKQAGIMATASTIRQYADTLTDIAVMGDKSEYNLYKQDLIALGASEAEADRQAKTEFFINQPLRAAIQGGATGVLTGGVKELVSGIKARLAKKGIASESAARTAADEVWDNFNRYTEPQSKSVSTPQLTERAARAYTPDAIARVVNAVQALPKGALTNAEYNGVIDSYYRYGLNPSLENARSVMELAEESLGNGGVEYKPEDGAISPYIDSRETTADNRLDKQININNSRKTSGELLNETECSISELYLYIKNIDYAAAEVFLKSGRWPDGIQMPKGPSVLNEDGSINWDKAPQGGYKLDGNGKAIKESYIPAIGEFIDRHGSPGGRYVCPVVDDKPFTYDQRSLPFSEDAAQYHQYEVTGDFSKICEYVMNCSDDTTKAKIIAHINRYYNGDYKRVIVYKGRVAAAFNSVGGAFQYEFPIPVEWLEVLGLLRKIN